MNKQTKKTELKNPVILLIMLSISLMFASCEQDPVVPPPPEPDPEIEDSNFFDWRVDTLWNILIYDYFVCDTHTAVLAGDLYGIIHKNGVISKKLRYHDKFPAFAVASVNGSDENNVYFGGQDVNENREMLIHWNGVDFKEINLPERIPGYIRIVENASENDYWLSSSNNKSKIYRYNNFVMTSYYFDVGADSCIWKSNFAEVTEDGKVYVIIGKTYSLSTNVYFVYLFNGNTFDFIRKDSIVNNNGIPYGGLFSIKNDLTFGSKTGLYLLSGNEYVKFLDFKNLIFLASRGAGESLTGFMFLGQSKTGNMHLFYVQGNKFYRQSGFWVGNLELAPIFYKYGRYYMIQYEWDFYESFLITGTPKKQF